MISVGRDAIRASSVKRAAFWTKWLQIAPFSSNRDIDLITRCDIYGACIRSVLMYCSETWVQTKAKSSSFKSADMKALRRFTVVTYTDRVSNEAVIKKSGLADLDKLQVRSRLRWYSHVHERENDHARKLTDYFSVPGKRPAGRLDNAGSIV